MSSQTTPAISIKPPSHAENDTHARNASRHRVLIAQTMSGAGRVQANRQSPRSSSFGIPTF